MLCPNCHSQTKTYTGKNTDSEKINTGDYISDDDIISVLNDSYNIHQALKKLNLSVSSHYYIKFKDMLLRGDAELKNSDCERACEKCVSVENRKVKNRPSLEELERDVENFGYRGTGKKYGVSDNSIRKWITQYQKT